MPRGKAKAPKALKFLVDLSDVGVPFISNVEFDNHVTSSYWGKSFVPSLELDEDGNPRVRVYIIDQFSNAFEIYRSPFTGGEIITEVNDKAFDEIVAKLSALGETPEMHGESEEVDEVVENVSDDSTPPWDEDEDDEDGDEGSDEEDEELEDDETEDDEDVEYEEDDDEEGDDSEYDDDEYEEEDDEDEE